jgi:hypothetical protein
MGLKLMAIDGCTYSFEALAAQVLPAHFQRLQQAMKNPRLAQDFVGFGSASKALLGKVGRDEDFPGCYVFLVSGAPVYVGISRGLVKLLGQHLNSKSHLTASLVCRTAFKEYTHAMKREQAMQDDKFRQEFSRLQKTSVAYIDIENDLELYTFGVYASMKLDTSRWNTFRTH